MYREKKGGAAEAARNILSRGKGILGQGKQLKNAYNKCRKTFDESQTIVEDIKRDIEGLKDPNQISDKIKPFITKIDEFMGTSRECMKAINELKISVGNNSSSDEPPPDE